MIEVERWNNWEYPSHWMYEESFSSIEEAIEYCLKQNNPSDYRVITVVWNKD